MNVADVTIVPQLLKGSNSPKLGAKHLYLPYVKGNRAECSTKVRHTHDIVNDCLPSLLKSA